jgi:RHS repeat-associated protein
VNRLTAADYDNGDSYHYSYDAVGSRTAQESVLDGVTASHTYTYDNDNRIASVDSQPYTWDANGNLTSDGEYTYNYDTANRLTSLTSNGVTTNYSYNGLGDRLTYSNSEGNYRQYSLDLNGELPQVLQDGIASYLYGLDLLGYDEWDERYTYQTDVLGSIRQIARTDPTGAVTWVDSVTDYDPYGNVIRNTTNYNNTGYTGEFQDRSLNDMVYLWARYYAPRTGVFLSRDTWAGDANQPMSYNKWAYTNGNPVNYTDPSGKDPSVTIGNATFSCSVYEDLCHWYGVIPDNEGIANVNNHREDFDNTIYPYNLDETTIAAAIAVQSQWLYSAEESAQKANYELWKKIYKGDCKKISEKTNPGLGYAQIAVFDTENRNKSSKDPNVKPVDIMQFGDPYIMSNSINAMIQRIYKKVGNACLNQCSAKDKLIIIAMAQNVGFNFEDLGDLRLDNNGKIDANIDWNTFFGNQTPLQNRSDSARTDTRAGKYINFNTRFQLKLYIQDMRELTSKYTWSLPNGITSQGVLDDIYHLAETGHE